MKNAFKLYYVIKNHKRYGYIIFVERKRENDTLYLNLITNYNLEKTNEKKRSKLFNQSYKLHINFDIIFKCGVDSKHNVLSLGKYLY